jgi:predicted tellurium resistance membrane protein TerC
MLEPNKNKNKRVAMVEIQADKILEQAMDRKVFLKTTGIALVGLVGITAVVKRLNIFSENLVAGTSTKAAQSSVSMGYGSAPYGR